MTTPFKPSCQPLILQRQIILYENITLYNGSQISINIFFLLLTWVSGQLARTSTNSTGPEVNDHVRL